MRRQRVASPRLRSALLFAAAMCAGCTPSARPAAGIHESPARSAVGTVWFTVTDATRHDLRDPSRARQWIVQVYYAAVPTAVTKAYADDPVLLDELVKQNYYETGEVTLRAWGTLPAVAAERALPASTRPLPVITISPGLGFARLNYAHLAAALVRRGYVVVVIDHPYIGVSRLPDGRLLRSEDDPAMASEDESAWVPRLKDWTEDVTVVLDRLAAGAAARLAPGISLDLDRVTATGHSIGGMFALDVCGMDQRVGGCVDFEGPPGPASQHGATRPTLVVRSRAGGRPPIERPPGTPDFVDTMLSTLGSRGARVWVVKVTGGSHTSYSDAPLVMPATLSRFGGVLMDADRSMALYSGLVDAFARAYVLGGDGDRAFEAFLASAPETSGRHS